MANEAISAESVYAKLTESYNNRNNINFRKQEVLKILNEAVEKGIDLDEKIELRKPCDCVFHSNPNWRQSTVQVDHLSVRIKETSVSVLAGKILQKLA
ncbi:MAG: hypothetical protein C5B47_06800 [Verrucomicrobia bacterium]|nr:MAG: hypothetical protein C5B47_06800 [Verrucomicrobiota bacterium]